jgi:hypothetical protein
MEEIGRIGVIGTRLGKLKISESGESGVWDTVGIIRFREEDRDGGYVHGGIIAQKGRGPVALQMLNGLQRLKSLWRGR